VREDETGVRMKRSGRFVEPPSGAVLDWSSVRQVLVNAVNEPTREAGELRVLQEFAK
jgi:hypothetical protein